MDGLVNVVARSSTLPRGKVGATRYHERGPPEGEWREEYRVDSIAERSTASVEKHPVRGMKLNRKDTVRIRGKSGEGHRNLWSSLVQS